MTCIGLQQVQFGKLIYLGKKNYFIKYIYKWQEEELEKEPEEEEE